MRSPVQYRRICIAKFHGYFERHILMSLLFKMVMLTALVCIGRSCELLFQSRYKSLIVFALSSPCLMIQEKQTRLNSYKSKTTSRSDFVGYIVERPQPLAILLPISSVEQYACICNTLLLSMSQAQYVVSSSCMKNCVVALSAKSTQTAM